MFKTFVFLLSGHAPLMAVPYYHSAMFTVALGTTCDRKVTIATINKMKLFVTVQVFPAYLKIPQKKIPM
jgi:hypothetical protein